MAVEVTVGPTLEQRIATWHKIWGIYELLAFCIYLFLFLLPFIFTSFWMAQATSTWSSTEEDCTCEKRFEAVCSRSTQKEEKKERFMIFSQMGLIHVPKGLYLFIYF